MWTVGKHLLRFGRNVSVIVFAVVAALTYLSWSWTWRRVVVPAWAFCVSFVVYVNPDDASEEEEGDDEEEEAQMERGKAVLRAMGSSQQLNFIIPAHLAVGTIQQAAVDDDVASTASSSVTAT